MPLLSASENRLAPPVVDTRGRHVVEALDVDLTDLVVGYGYGINAPRGNDFGGQEFDAQFQFKY